MGASNVFAIPIAAVFLLFTCIVVQCALFFPGHCPTDRPIVKDFDINKYSGRWYEFYRKKQSYDFLGDCNTVTYTAHENGTIGVKQFRLLPDPVREETEESYAVFTDPNQKPLEGRWNISYQWNDPFFENHRIMDTDYETYSITFICLPGGPDFSIDEFVIYTRKPEIPVDLEKKLQDTVAQHYNMTLLFKPKHNCQTKDNLVV